MRRQLFTVLLLLGILSVLIWQLRLETKLSIFFLGQTDDGSQLVARFQGTVFARRYLLAVESQPGSEAGVPALSIGFIDKVTTLPGVKGVWPAFQPPFSVPQLMASYADRAPLIYSLNPQEEGPRLLSVESLPERAERLKKALLSPFGDLVQQIAKRDPLLLTLHAFSDWRDHLTLADDGRDGFYPIIVESRFEPFDVNRQRSLQHALRQVFAELNQSHGGTFHLRMTGVPIFATTAHSRIKQDVNVVTTASGLGVLAVLFGLFRSWRVFPALLVVLLFAWSAGALATQWFFGYVHGLTLALGATLIGVCVDYPIHLLAHCQQGQRPIQVARRLWPALALGAITTVIGYLVLVATGYPGFQQTAVFAGTGILAALFVTRYVFPAWVGDPPLGFSRLPGVDAWLIVCRNHPRRVLAGVGLLLMSALVFLPRLEWLDDLERLAQIDPTLLREDRALRVRLGGIEPGRAVLVTGADMETALQRAEAATRILRALKAEGKVSRFFPVYPWLVSRNLQQSNWDQYRVFITPRFISSWREALQAKGLAIGPLGLKQPGQEPVSWLKTEQVLDSMIREILVGQIDRGERGVRVALWLGSHEPAVVAKALTGLDGVRYFSQRQQINTLAEQYRRRAILVLSIGVGVIGVILIGRYRSFSRAFRILLSSLLGLVFIFSCFAVLGQPVSFFHLIAAMLAVAICVDYGIFYSERRGGDAAMTYRAMGASMLTTVTAFAALGLADNPVLRTLSIAVTSGVASGFLLCPVLLPIPAHLSLSIVSKNSSQAGGHADGTD